MWRLNDLEHRMSNVEKTASNNVASHGELRGRFLTWDRLLMVSIGVLSSLFTAWMMKPPERDGIEVRQVMEQLIDRLDREERARMEKHR